ncbi:MAG: anion permease [Phycisphaerae bacterium]
MVLVLIAVCVLAFANGANDNAKGVATLIGGRTWPRNRALTLALVTTFMGSVAAILLAGGLVAKFSGKGLIDDAILTSAAFPTCVAVAAGVTVLLATRLAMPISTTHALVGAIVGVGLGAHGLHVASIVSAFFVPLLVAPLLAIGLAAVGYVMLRFVRLRLQVNRNTCVCIERTYHPVQVEPCGSLLVAATGVKLANSFTVSDCVDRYDGQIAGIDAQRVLDTSHILSAAAISFARGLNDTPKIAALMIAAGGFTASGSLIGVGIAMALGGALAVRRVAETMSHKVTEMNDGQAFTANLATAACVLVASRFGVPVSTTHVSCGSLFGIGMVNGQAHVPMIAKIGLAWVTTLPLAAALGWTLWKLLA